MLYELDPKSGSLTITHKKPYKYNESVRNRSPYLIRTFGERLLGIIGDIGALTFLLIFFGLPFLPGFILEEPELWHFLLFFLLTILIVVIGFKASNTVDYYRDSKCRKCGKDFACEEFKEPDEKQECTPTSYEKNEISFWKCKYCGNKDTRIKNINESHNIGETNSTPNMNCPKCGKEKAVKEYRRPNTFSEGCVEVTIRYYKCRSCDYNAVEIIRDYEDCAE